MRILSFDPQICVGCYVCEEACSETFFEEANPEKSRIRVHDEGEGPLGAVFCNQCGACIVVCPTQALYRDRRGVVRMREERCVGCLSCAGFCPYLAMFYHVDDTEPFKCISCGVCARECPSEALDVVEVGEPPAEQ